MSNYSEDFLQGQIDCRDGKVHQGGMPEGYDDGFSTQHTMEQVDTEMNLANDRRMEMVL